jgi:uncharacterized protein
MIQQVIKFAQTKLKGRDPAHDFLHASRVKRLSHLIANAEGVTNKVSLDNIAIAALLHDVEDPKFYTKDYSEVSIFLSKMESLSDERVDKIMRIIDGCSFRKEVKSMRKREMTIEEKIVQDADRIDAIGAIGVARCFIYSGSKCISLYNTQNLKDPKTTVGHFYDKLLKLGQMMKTKTGAEISEKRHKFLTDFLLQFLKECDLRDVPQFPKIKV